ncbi:MAG TPA: EI24 domain-containing protein [Burkholderiaceae bacterium]
MKALVFSFGRALASQFHPRMMLMTLAPFLVALAFWSVVLWQTLQPLYDALQRFFVENDVYAVSAKWLAFFGLAALKVFVVPLIAMWLLLPLMVATSLVFVSFLATPAVVRHVGRRHHADLERRQGGDAINLLWITLTSFLLFILFWLITLPLCALPVIGFAVQPLLWGWLTCRVLASEVFGTYADGEERALLMRRHRWPLLLIGTLTGVLGMAPSALWMGSPIAMAVLGPILAGISLWLYVLVFTFSGLWFTHYCLAALEAHRHSRSMETEVALEEAALS